ncbi:hypothetical protein J2X36_004540 [Methylobacterium sp. BE186]|nr:hypothetical protein [Methylobacterium sp. BE186]
MRLLSVSDMVGVMAHLARPIAALGLGLSRSEFQVTGSCAAPGGKHVDRDDVPSDFDVASGARTDVK